jgi:hypothetical protein
LGRSRENLFAGSILMGVWFRSWVIVFIFR